MGGQVKKLTFLVELTIINGIRLFSHYILVRAENEDAACKFATECYEKKQKAVGDVITNTWAEPFEDEDDYLIIL